MIRYVRFSGQPRLPAYVLFGLMAGLLVGCGPAKPELFPVSGTVKLNGKPLTTGSVQFIGQGLRPASGQINADGTFKLATDGQDGCAAGVHKVLVRDRKSVV